ncbi:Rossmann-fold NAD(P)-binding domain-containing protein [Methanolobus profundi]|uniref:Uncharacterized protein n=1 Tax=Methanolobus profundi TaxID=487685 RepID=A0A1I4V1F9_9EURY|nr:hypothetical protein [Methanolobus profundi]SFM94593.1 hypothetical protein SAMN04488696_2958 [Methanolobus profundi]SFM95064.1 hypothetical protein SAMN04488696_2973 [Methanolobus profundi]
MKKNIGVLITIVISFLFMNIVSLSTDAPTSEVEIAEFTIDSIHENTPKASGEWGQIQESTYFNAKLSIGLIGATLGIVGFLDFCIKVKDVFS